MRDRFYKYIHNCGIRCKRGEDKLVVAISQLELDMPNLYAKLPAEFEVITNDDQLRLFGRWLETHKEDK